ncbi:MAG: hypothetical protein AAF485_24425, partial [Chloroflexota bacterium]
MNDTVRFPTHQLFDTDRYPIHQRKGDDYKALLAQAHQGLQEENCCQLPAFIRPEIVADMQAEADRLAEEATFTRANLTPYFTEPPTDVPESHPLRRLAPRTHGMVRADKFSRDDVIWAMFQNQDLCNFVADALGYETLYTYRDPYGSVNINVQPQGAEFAWHFDNNDFTVSFGLKRCLTGGVFEYVPDIRTDDDQNYEGVQAILDGEREGVRALVLKPGDLQLFRGGYTLHRVTAPVDTGRQSLLFSYVTDPN